MKICLNKKKKEILFLDLKHQYYKDVNSPYTQTYTHIHILTHTCVGRGPPKIIDLFLNKCEWVTYKSLAL